MTMHRAWDDGAIDEMFAPFGVTSKTTKTVCGKRVKIEQTSRTPDCPECLRIDAERKAALAAARAYRFPGGR